ncbi:MAG: shikimate dehydrogenase [Patulibacter sp.]
MTAGAATSAPERAWRLGVFGWPVHHSRSPVMHTAALRDLDLDHWSYQKLPVPPDALAGAIAGLRDAGFAGANVTIPHKHAALTASDVATAAAREIGAVNTLTVLDDGTLEGDNTDAPGLIDVIGRPLAGTTAVVLGAGGSARACVWALREAGCARVAVWNRTAERASELADDLGVDVAEAVGPADVLVNCTSVGLHEPERTFELLPVGERDLPDYGTVVDLVYRAGGTPLFNAAQAAGIPAVDGLSFLVAQGARSLERWTGRDVSRRVMDAAVRADAV